MSKRVSVSAQPYPQIKHHTVRRIIKKMKASRTNLYNFESKKMELLHGFLVTQNLPREASVACFHILIGHHYIQGHFYRIRLAISPICPLCAADEMTVNHLYSCCYFSDKALSADLVFSNSVYKKLFWCLTD